MGDIPPGLVRVPLGGFGRRDGAQQLPEELHVDVVHRPAHGEVVQLARGKRVQFVTGHPWTLSPAPGPRAATRDRSARYSRGAPWARRGGPAAVRSRVRF